MDGKLESYVVGVILILDVELIVIAEEEVETFSGIFQSYAAFPFHTFRMLAVYTFKIEFISVEVHFDMNKAGVLIADAMLEGVLYKVDCEQGGTMALGICCCRSMLISTFSVKRRRISLI